MAKHLLLGIDIGTSGCKITAFNFQGDVVASQTETYATFYPAVNWVEHDPLHWWNAVCKGINGMIRSGKLHPREIAAIGVAGLSWSWVPMDEGGRPLRRVMIWLDRRAEGPVQWMKEQAGEERLFSLSGNPIDPAYGTPKILWLKEHEPEVYRKTHQFLQSNSYIVYKLTGAYTQEYSQAYAFHFFNMSQGRYDEQMAETLGINLEKFPPLSPCHAVVGTVTTAAAQETGLVPGTPVVAGGLDAACCTLGAGVIQPGQTQEQGGQAGGMSIVLDKPRMHPRLILGYHVVPGLWLLQGGTVGGSGTLRWFREELGAYEEQLGQERGISPFVVMSEEAARIRPGSDGLIFLPYMAGERSPIWDSNARGVFFGLSFNKTRAHMIRAMMEGVGYSLRHNLETALEAQAETEFLVSVGGAANSAVWTQLKADIIGKVIQVPFSDHATTLGAAILAGVGVGVYRDFASAVKETVRIQRIHEPNPINHQIYTRYYQLYLKLYQQLKGCFGDLAELSLGE